MALHQHKRAIGIFTNRDAVTQALQELNLANFPLAQVTVIARELEEESLHDTDRKTRKGNQAAKQAANGAVVGGVIGLVTGVLVGVGAASIPLIGPIMLADALGTAVATTLAGTGIGAVSGGLLGALIGLGIPKKHAKAYHERFLRGDFLVIVEGTDDQIRQAISLLKDGGIEEVGIYNAPEMDGINTDFPVTAVDEPHAQMSRSTVYREPELN
ncbi:MAG: general stress protein [Coleofasciculus chthonoplastes F3-SA18-01]|uniref:general stress protein n=1 Tax=Coleofasciculus chthonoplastes TaxID=64178 RepID=UPI0032FA4F3E